MTSVDMYMKPYFIVSFKHHLPTIRTMRYGQKDFDGYSIASKCARFRVEFYTLC